MRKRFWLALVGVLSFVAFAPTTSAQSQAVIFSDRQNPEISSPHFLSGLLQRHTGLSDLYLFRHTFFY